MSAYLLGLGFRADMGTCVRKLVLLKLIDACEDDGSRIFPAVATVARAAQCSPRQVQRELKAFVDCGLIRLVREGGKGPKSTNEYEMDLDLLARIAKQGWSVAIEGAAVAKGDTVSPLAEDAKGDTGDTLRVTPETPKGDKLSHPTPPYPSIDPSERESAGARDEEGQEGQEEPDDERPTTPIADRRKLERRVKRMGQRWPNWVGSSTDWTVRRFAALSEEDRQAAERHVAAYLAHCDATKGVKAVALGVYIRDRKWTDLPASALLAVAATGKAVEAVAKPFGPQWGAQRMVSLLAGPQPIRIQPTAFLARLMAQDDEQGRRERLSWQARHGFPAVNFMDQQAANRRGVPIDPAISTLVALMEPVQPGSVTWHAWMAHHDAIGWPWLSDPGEQPVVYFPRGGPDGLGAFEQAMAQLGRGGHDGDRRQAAE